MLSLRHLTTGLALALAVGAVRPAATRAEDVPAGEPRKAAGPAHLDAGSGLLIVSGDAELVSDDFSGGRKDVTNGATRVWGGTAGFPFVASLVDWMTGSDDVRSIRAGGTQADAPAGPSEASRRVLARLTSPARISVYWGEKVPARAEPVRRRLEGLLEALVASSGGRLQIDWVKMNEAGRAQASTLAIQEEMFQEVGQNVITTVKDYCGLSIAYGSGRESVGPLVEMGDDSETLRLCATIEYELAAALDKASWSKKAVVGLVRDASRPTPAAPRSEAEGQYSLLAEGVLAKVYGGDFRDGVDLKTSVPIDVTVLVVVAPREWSAPQTYHLEQFLLRGGRVLLLLDPVDVRAAWGDKPTAHSGLDEWLESVGVKVKPGVVGDSDKDHMGAAITRDGSLTPYPFFVQALRAELSQECPVTSGFASVPFYFPGELVVDAKRQAAAGRTVTVLATTSATGFVRRDTTGLADMVRVKADAGVGAKRVLLVQFDGPFTSFWKGKPAPADAPLARPASPPEVPPAVPAPAAPLPSAPAPSAPVPSVPARASAADVAKFLSGWADAVGADIDATTGYPKRIRRTKDAAVMVLIPAGTFQMGAVPGDASADDAETPRHRVTLSKAYYLDETEVTVGMWRKYVAGGGGKMPSGEYWRSAEATDAHPMREVSWDAVQGYARWAQASLPTEAQWERAAKGGHDGYVYPWGSADPWKRCNGPWAGQAFGGGAAPVKSFAANDFGLYDMSGNVPEWCADWFGESYYAKSPAQDPSGPESGSERVLRGGSFMDDEVLLRSSARTACAPSGFGGDSGFRLARNLP